MKKIYCDVEWIGLILNLINNSSPVFAFDEKKNQMFVINVSIEPSVITIVIVLQ